MEELKDGDFAMNHSVSTEIKIDDPEKDNVNEECELNINIVVENDAPNKEIRSKKGRKKEERVKTGDEEDDIEEEKSRLLI